MRHSLTLQRNSIAPLNNGSTATGLYSSTAASSHNVSDYITSRNPITDSSTMASHAIIGSGLHENLFLHPEVHNPTHHTQRRGTDAFKSKSNGFGNGIFGQVTIEVTADELISDGIAATRLCSIFGPFVFLMACVGLYHPSSEDVTPERDTCFSGGWCLRWLLIFWSAAVALFLVFNVVSIGYYVDVYPSLDVLSVTELLIVMRLLKALIVLFFFFLIFESSERYEEMLETWCMWLRWQSEKNMSHSRRWIFVMTCLTLIYATVPSVLTGLSVFGYIDHMGLQSTAFAGLPYDRVASFHYALRITFTVSMIIANLIVGLFCGFFSSICLILQYEMRLLAREIQVEVRGQAVIWDMKIEPLSGQEVTVMEFLRRKHGKIIAVVQAVDHSFREVLFLHYLFGIPKTIFEIFLLLTTAPVGYVGFKGTIILFVVLGLLEMFTVWLSAVKVHTWAHQPAKILPTIDIHEKKEITHAHQTSLGLFMSSLTTEKIAMTLWGIVPLTKEFIIVVTVFIVTYLIILVDSSHTVNRRFNGARLALINATIAPTLPPFTANPSSEFFFTDPVTAGFGSGKVRENFENITGFLQNAFESDIFNVTVPLLVGGSTEVTWPFVLSATSPNTPFLEPDRFVITVNRSTAGKR